jgi:4-alpha-glucanotransferase
MAYSSVAKTAILPMQDILGLDAQYRMNTPGSSESNWLWRLKPEQVTPEIETLLRNWTKFYNRY